MEDTSTGGVAVNVEPQWSSAFAMYLIAGVAICSSGGCTREDSISKTLARIVPPPLGNLYHGVYPGGTSGEEDDITSEDIESYIQAVGQNAAWVYFSDNWYRSRAFPIDTASMIRDHGAIPFVRLMLRSSAVEDQPEPVFHLAAILAGEFDDDLDAWGSKAREFGDPLLLEWGTECNGEWFSWNGTWNGGEETTEFGSVTAPDGPERFVAAYRHIVQRLRGSGADNVTFVWHVNAVDVPDESWNSMEHYYPGDDTVDWLGVSVYGPLTPLSEDAPMFTSTLDTAYPRLSTLGVGKPIIVAEFGCAANHAVITSKDWADDALTQLFANRWPRIIGFSWWNEHWENDDDALHDTTMRVQEIPELGSLFRSLLADHAERLSWPASVETVPPRGVYRLARGRQLDGANLARHP